MSVQTLQAGGIKLALFSQCQLALVLLDLAAGGGKDAQTLAAKCVGLIPARRARVGPPAHNRCPRHRIARTSPEHKLRLVQALQANNEVVAMTGEHALWRIAFVSLLIGGATIAVFLFEEHRGYSIEMAQTMAVNTLVLGQAFYLFNSRFLRESSLRLDWLFTNRVVWIAIGVLAVPQLVFVYAPFMNLWFHSAPIAARDWLLPIGIGFAIFLAVEAEKALLRKLKS
jgi:magnesium-transporting ATPase (P-type)